MHARTRPGQAARYARTEELIKADYVYYTGGEVGIIDGPERA
jgi:hypothetical protein